MLQETIAVVEERYSYCKRQKLWRRNATHTARDKSCGGGTLLMLQETIAVVEDWEQG